jgi:ATP-dependent DNA helicase Rep
MGMSILRRDGGHLGYQPGFSVLDSQDSMQLIDELTRKSRLTIDPGAVRNTISHWKNATVPPQQATETAEDDLAFAAAQIYTEYQRYLKAYNTTDFDDLILQPVALLREYDETRNKWRERTRHLLVDEYQDTNLAQYELVRLITGVEACSCSTARIRRTDKPLHRNDRDRRCERNSTNAGGGYRLSAMAARYQSGA